MKLYEKIRFLQSFPAKVLTHTYTYKVQPINSHYTNAIHTYLNTYMYLYNHTSRVTQAMHMEQRFQQICLIKMLLFYMNHGYSSSSCLLTCCQEKTRDNILAYAYSKVNYFISLQKQKRQLRTHRVYITISYLLVMLLTLASDLVIFLYREDRRPLRTRRVVIPCNMRSGWTRSPHSAERYLPVINILL